jgi:hypothetical protein
MTTDWKALGLDFRSPFDILGRPRVQPAEPKPRRRKPRMTSRDKTLASLREKGEARS